MSQEENIQQQITRIQQLLDLNPPPVKIIRQILAGLGPFLNEEQVSQIDGMVEARLANPPQKPDNG